MKQQPERRDRGEVPLDPALFICLGTSGAGVTTAVQQAMEEQLLYKASSQFTTRKPRVNESHGKPYYYVTDEILKRAQAQIAFEYTMYAYRYGYFYPALSLIKRGLQEKNIFLDTGVTPNVVRGLIGSDERIISIFFAPNHPFISIERIINRSLLNDSPVLKEELLNRAFGNKNNISSIWNFDYWVDTTTFSNIYPAFRSVIKSETFRAEIQPLAVKIPQSNSVIEELVKNYQEIDPRGYIEEKANLLNLR